ncbi:TIPRL [Branchiostoma lanceolatum]|uniref:TIP41-like protein n=1 Tax=Branchiostoma lanceolatum TaxID=7740 RepID=A0A8J9WCF3_BRALA|nr:TIPRL [Branchiostoma lanceolatum]
MASSSPPPGPSHPPRRMPTPRARKVEDFSFGPWTITAVKSHIMPSDDMEKLASQLDIPQLPEMLFGQNVLRIKHSGGFGIEFNAVDHMKLVDNKHDLMKVAVSEAWREARAGSEHIHEVIKPFDWTFTSNYKGTLLKDSVPLQVEETIELIDIEKLKQRERIVYFEEVVLFEDELADNGCSTLSVKIRVMPTSFFLLMRFFLRVDNVIIRVHDTRLYHEADKDYFLREFSSKENNINDLVKRGVPPRLLHDPNEIVSRLDSREMVIHKLKFPQVQTTNTDDPQKTHADHQKTNTDPQADSQKTDTTDCDSAEK